MFWTILPHASMCISAERVIMLDVRSDRYFMVPPAASGAIRTWLAKTPPATLPGRLVDLLRAAGVHRPGDPEPYCVPQTRIAVPKTLPGCFSSSSVTVRGIAAVSRSILSARIDLARRPLAAALSDHRGFKRIEPADPDLQSALAGTFEAARRFVPIERRCLIDSLALVRWLEQHGQRADLVFGVSGLPFAAHCWVQNTALLLNDSYDRVSRFTPIRVQ